MKPLLLHLFTLPAVARLNRRLAGLALLWLLTLLLLNPVVSAQSGQQADHSTSHVATAAKFPAR